MLIIFDLDGTLIDSMEDLAISVNATRHQFGFDSLDQSVIHSYVGNGAAVLIRKSMGAEASDELVDEALPFFLQFYRKHALEHTRLYPGIRELVEELAKANHKLAVLTNKPVRISNDIVAALGLGSKFFRVYGGDSFSNKKPDPAGIFELMKEAGVMAEETWMVGDSGVDVKTAQNAAVRCCGVAWGFEPEAFAQNPPTLIANKPADILRQIASTN